MYERTWLELRSDPNVFSNACAASKNMFHACNAAFAMLNIESDVQML